MEKISGKSDIVLGGEAIKDLVFVHTAVIVA